jgi:hypothetical protein
MFLVARAADAALAVAYVRSGNRASTSKNRNPARTFRLSRGSKHSVRMISPFAMLLHGSRFALAKPREGSIS